MVERWSTGKCHDSTSLKLKAIAKCGGPKPMAKAIKSYPRATCFNTHDCDMEGTKLFGSTKRKLDLSPCAKYDSRRSDKVNYSIPRPNTRARKTCIEESLHYVGHGVADITSVLEIDDPNS